MYSYTIHYLHQFLNETRAPNKYYFSLKNLYTNGLDKMINYHNNDVLISDRVKDGYVINDNYKHDESFDIESATLSYKKDWYERFITGFHFK